MLPQQYCLRWKYHHSNLQTMFSQLLDRGCFCDVTLACEGQLIRAHRVVLCACSTFFDTVLTNYASERDPIIIIKDVTFADVKCLIEFMYKGEINVEHGSLASLLKTADDLKIKGLAEVTWRDDDPDPFMMPDSRMQENIPQNDQRTSPRGIHDGQMSSPLGPTVNTRVHRMPMLNPMPTAGVGEYVGPKRKRGRPPLDDSYDVFSTPKITHIPPHCDMMYPEVRTQLNSSPVDEQPQLQHPHNQQQQQHQHQQQHHTTHEQEEPLRTTPEPTDWPQPNNDPDINPESPDRIMPPETLPTAVSDYYNNNESQDELNERDQELTIEEDRKYSIDHDAHDISCEDQGQEKTNSKMDDLDTSETALTTEELAQWGDVVKMDAYLAKGRRPQFWEEPFTRRVLDAIKNKKLEMKKAAKVLGVSYGTLYGRYREVYGCLKHPYRASTTMMNRYDLVWPQKRSDSKLRDPRDVWLR